MARRLTGFVALDADSVEFAGDADPQLSEALKAEVDKRGGKIVSRATGATVYQADRLFTVAPDGETRAGGFPEELPA